MIEVEVAKKDIKHRLETYADGYRSAAEEHFNTEHPNPPDKLVSLQELENVGCFYAKRDYADLPFGPLLYAIQIAAQEVNNQQYGR